MASIDKRRDGRYRARWREYPGAPQRSRHFDRKVDAERHLVKIQHDLLTGAYLDPASSKVTLSAFARRGSADAPELAAGDRGGRDEQPRQALAAGPRRPLARQHQAGRHRGPVRLAAARGVDGGRRAPASRPAPGGGCRCGLLARSPAVRARLRGEWQEGAPCRSKSWSGSTTRSPSGSRLPYPRSWCRAPSG